VQGGRCRTCRAPIGITYPLVELTSALAFMALLWRFGTSGQALAALLMVSLLIALAVIDHQTRLLPDAITQPLLWSGLLVNTQALMVPLEAAVIGAAAGYLSLWTVHHAFRRLTGREGMGYGDFKLLAGLGAWLGWMALPGIVLVASAGGTLYGVTRILLRQQHRHEPIAFGPWLVLGGLVLLWLS
jgi:leader peptidase (prepilin peptidase)/N-methyltransferase